MNCRRVAAAACVGCLLMPSVILQAVGFFSPYWVKQDSTSNCFRGVYSTVNCDDTIEGLGDTILGLEATGLFLMALTVLVSMCSICCMEGELEHNGNEKKCCVKFGICLTMLYFVAGFIGFLGSAFVFDGYNDNDKGWGLYVSMAGSGYVVLIFIRVCKKKEIDASTSALLN
ncbi:uncharacterized protein LOC134235504 [Saccostrea cucullata]|uniref:uncharacterized protein LOC134235504 n=1 Tax=Saccostrea cuccullata TaxID=36930 RepID=UPI002ED1072F